MAPHSQSVYLSKLTAQTYMGSYFFSMRIFEIGLSIQLVFYMGTSRGLPYNLHAKRNHPIEITQGMDED